MTPPDRRKAFVVLCIIGALYCVISAVVAGPIHLLPQEEADIRATCPPGVKVIDGLPHAVTTLTGQRCVPANCIGPVDGIVWDATSTNLLGKYPRRTPQQASQIWLATSTEAHGSYTYRRIGDPEWMLHMNYAIGIGETDFPRLSPSLRWKTVPPAVFAQKNKNILYMSSNCKAESQRDSFMKVAERYMDIDSVGNCNNNRKWPARLASNEFDSSGRSKRLSWRDYGTSNALLLKSYHFRLLIISTLCENYWAEKVQQTLDAGVIPIYLGIPNSHDWDPGIAAEVHPAMIHIQDFNSLVELAQFVNKLGEDTQEARNRRQAFFEFTRVNKSFTFPRHRASIEKATGARESSHFYCNRVHDGSATRRASPQPLCHGPWWKYLESRGHNLTLWDIDETQRRLAGFDNIKQTWWSYLVSFMH